MPPELSFAAARVLLDVLAAVGSEWAGLPMPIEGERLVIHKSYPYAHLFENSGLREGPSFVCTTEDVQEEEFIVNRWYSTVKKMDVAIVRSKGKTELLYLPGSPHHLDMELKTLGATVAWPMKAEARAIRKLKTLVTPHAFRCYRLTGSFLETSKRSKVTYLFRRLRPTVAMSGATGDMRILCCLCAHPVGYIDGSWAGCMVPSDDVVAALMMMRGDEHLFWKQANQIPAWRPEAGL